MGSTVQLPDGRWRAFESVGSGPSRVTANATRTTKRAAQAAARSRLATKLEEAAALEPHTLTVKAYLVRWIAHLKTQGRSGKSVARYESICDALPKTLSRRLLADLRPLHLQHWLDDTDKAPATVRKHYAVIHAALAQAVTWRLLESNPMGAVKRPRLERSDTTALNEQQTADLLTALQGTRFWAPALLAATTGMRRGELLALRWRDVDLEAAELRVTRSADEVPGKAVAFKRTKTGKGRSVALMAATVTCLKAHHKQQAAEKLAAKVWHDRGLVFPNRHGDPWRPSTFSVLWGRQAAVATAGVRFHDLRHTHATLLLRAGVPVDAVSKRLGHATPVVTMQVYAHVLEDADAAAVARLEEGLGTALAADSVAFPVTS
jgi:integrase